jgi:hypothetical protein
MPYGEKTYPVGNKTVDSRKMLQELHTKMHKFIDIIY